MTLEFRVPGDPRGKGRPRFSSAGGHVRTYTDDKTASYENLVSLAAARALDGAAPFGGPVSVYMRAEFSIPAGANATKRAAMLAGEIEPTKLPDLDNVLKAVLDGCNRVAFTDDKLVTHIHAVKVYGATPGVTVTITPSKDA
jgi:Holliday junction resolvase RusA-like endonuclease